MPTIETEECDVVVLDVCSIKRWRNAFKHYTPYTSVILGSSQPRGLNGCMRIMNGMTPQVPTWMPPFGRQRCQRFAGTRHGIIGISGCGVGTGNCHLCTAKKNTKTVKPRMGGRGMGIPRGVPRCQIRQRNKKNRYRPRRPEPARVGRRNKLCKVQI